MITHCVDSTDRQSVDHCGSKTLIRLDLHRVNSTTTQRVIDASKAPRMRGHKTGQRPDGAKAAATPSKTSSISERPVRGPLRRDNAGGVAGRSDSRDLGKTKSVLAAPG
jgi:hypothetical protein